jgi:hypothetical protein
MAVMCAHRRAARRPSATAVEDDLSMPGDAGPGQVSFRTGRARNRGNRERVDLDMNVSAGDTAWLLASAALVMLMTPALGFFYGGLVRRKNVLSTIMHSFL